MMEHGFNWMFFEIERNAADRRERDRMQRLRFEVDAAVRRCRERSGDVASFDGRHSIVRLLRDRASALRRFTARNRDLDGCTCGATS